MPFGRMRCEVCEEDKRLKDLWWCAEAGCHLLLCSLCRLQDHPEGHKRSITRLIEQQQCVDELYSALLSSESKRLEHLKDLFASIVESLWASCPHPSDQLAELFPCLDTSEGRELAVPEALGEQRAKVLAKELVEAKGGRAETEEDLMDKVEAFGVEALKERILELLCPEGAVVSPGTLSKAWRHQSLWSLNKAPKATLRAATSLRELNSVPEMTSCPAPLEKPHWTALGHFDEAEVESSQEEPDEANEDPTAHEAEWDSASLTPSQETSPSPVASESSAARSASPGLQEQSQHTQVTKPTAQVAPTSQHLPNIFVFGVGLRRTAVDSLFPCAQEPEVLSAIPYAAVTTKAAQPEIMVFLADGTVQCYQVLASTRQLIFTRLLPYLASQKHVNGAALAVGGTGDTHTVFLCGGEHEPRCCEMYQRDLWHPLPPMKAKRSFFALVAFDEHIYAIGGQGGLNSPYLRNVERLAISGEGDWSEPQNVPLLPVRLRSHAAVALDDAILVAGGETEDGRTTSDTWLLSRRKSRDWDWTQGPSLHFKRKGLGLVRLGSAVYALGGRGPAEGVARSIERLDLATHRWELMEERLPRASMYSSFAAY